MCDTLSALDPTYVAQYLGNANLYLAQIGQVDYHLHEIANARVRDRLVFADRMPWQYFLDEFGLRASAAFPGCSGEITPSAATMARLHDRLVKEHIPVVLYLETSDGQLARTLAAETGAQALQLQSLHTISPADFAAGETWVSLMTRNYPVLEAALW
ncbi:zinc ABC transporter substrate-binding protein [bacterium]|nr:zinc ABC transporter substrate-binding protein [bacterium]